MKSLITRLNCKVLLAHCCRCCCFGCCAFFPHWKQLAIAPHRGSRVKPMKYLFRLAQHEIYNQIKSKMWKSSTEKWMDAIEARKHRRYDLWVFFSCCVFAILSLFRRNGWTSSLCDTQSYCKHHKIYWLSWPASKASAEEPKWIGRWFDASSRWGTGNDENDEQRARERWTGNERQKEKQQ